MRCVDGKILLIFRIVEVKRDLRFWFIVCLGVGGGLRVKFNLYKSVI